MDDLEVEFPEPCSEPWEAMAPRGCNRHCASCDKIIHDLAALTFDEAAALLADEDEVCVRAEIGRGRVITLKPDGASAGRRMIAAAGASLALATAACQTVPDQETPRYAISGELNPYLAGMIELRSDGGKKQRRTLDRKSGQYAFTNLVPGTYTLAFKEPCGISTRLKTITIVDQSVTVTDHTVPEDEEGCPIIVGVMRPANRPERG